MIAGTYQNKITPAHLQKKAIVYLRQSSERQVRENTESQRLQYPLIDRAKELGFAEVEVIDGDLGSSASIGAKKIKFPVNRNPVNRNVGGEVKIVWQFPKKTFFEYLFHNLFYAGVYCWGRR